jgi:hypothetical protein
MGSLFTKEGAKSQLAVTNPAPVRPEVSARKKPGFLEKPGFFLAVSSEHGV